MKTLSEYTTEELLQQVRTNIVCFGLGCDALIEFDYRYLALLADAKQQVLFKETQP